MGLPERVIASDFSAVQSTKPLTINAEPDTSEQKLTHYTASKFSLSSNFFASTFSIFGSYIGFSLGERKESNSGSYGWTVVKKIMSVVSVRRLQELILWTRKPIVLSSTSDIWLLGICYKVSSEDSTNPDNGLVAFYSDFSSRIWMTYRKG